MGIITLDMAADCARVTIANPGKLNAIDVAMWRELRLMFERLQTMPTVDAPHAIIVCGADSQFASGGDIDEFTEFRFDSKRLREFHEDIVAPALHAMLNCDIPVYAQIEGACIGGGLEIAACCDIRICGESSRFGVPIAKLGFPMAPDELEVVSRVVAAPVLREMLLEARLFDAKAALAAGIVNEIVPDTDVASCVQHRAQQLAALSPQAARLNKRTLRHIARGPLTGEERSSLFDYADSRNHREGISAFIEKRAPHFQRG